MLAQYATRAQRAGESARLRAQLLELASRITSLEAQKDRQLALLAAVSLRRAAAEEALEARIGSTAADSRARASEQIRVAELRCDEAYWAEQAAGTAHALAALWARQGQVALLCRAGRARAEGTGNRA